MPRLIVHAGMPKTGTKTIQHTLSSNVSDNILGAQGIHYLKHPSIYVNHSKYLNSLLNRPPWRDPAEHEDNVARFTQAIHTAQYTLGPDCSMLVSVESVGEIARDYKDLAQVRDFFLGLFCGITVIVYVREPLGYMCSRMQESVKRGYPLHAAVRNAIAGADSTSAIENLQALFGPSNVTVRSYDPALLTGEDIVADFCISALGMSDCTEIRHLIENSSRHNFSLPSELTELLMLLYRNRSISPRTCCSRFAQLISDIPWAGTKFGPGFLSEGDRGRMLAAADEARDRLREYLGYDCFPSYSPTTEPPARARRAPPQQITVFRENIELLRKTIGNMAGQADAGSSEHAIEGDARDVQTRDEARDVAYHLLDRLYELCDTAR